MLIDCTMVGWMGIRSELRDVGSKVSPRIQIKVAGFTGRTKFTISVIQMTSYFSSVFRHLPWVFLLSLFADAKL
jgi:hypothetical protein